MRKVLLSAIFVALQVIAFSETTVHGNGKGADKRANKTGSASSEATVKVPRSAMLLKEMPTAPAADPVAPTEFQLFLIHSNLRALPFRDVSCYSNAIGI